MQECSSLFVWGWFTAPTKSGYVKTNQTVFETSVFTSFSTLSSVVAGSFKYSQKKLQNLAFFLISKVQECILT